MLKSAPVSTHVADFVLGPRDVPDRALTWASWLLLDTLGVCAAATPMDAGKIARNVTHRIYGTGSKTDRGLMLFDGRPASLPGVAYAAATQTDNLDAHDGYNPVKGHIGCAVVPALCALGQQMPELSGRDAMAALAISYEVAGRAGLALHDSVSDYHTSGAWNALGVAALAGRLKGHSPDILRHALGIAEYHGPRSQMMREIATPTMLHDGSGMGALVGLSAALLAEEGFTGAPAITVEAESEAHHWTGLGDTWLIEDQYVKPYPICRWAHAPIDAAGGLQTEHSFTHDQIEGITIHSFQNALELWSEMPRTTSEAQYSLAFAVAARLVHGHIGLDQISGVGLSDPAVARLVSITSLEHDAEAEANFPAMRKARTTITLKDGQRFTSPLVDASGGPQAPWGEAEITAKFDQFAAPVLGAARADALRDAILGLNAPNSSFAEVAAMLTDPV